MTAPACWLVGAEAVAVQARLPADLPWLSRPLVDAQALALALSGLQPPHAPRILLLASASDQADEAELAIRAELHRANLPYQVLFPDGGNHLTQVRRCLGLEPVPTRTEYAPWTCEACSDPACEHRLFRRLMVEKNRP
ncbi:MAG: hypothetical protein LRY31_02210 [Burkholderiaceae bacterium]|nr:hypothetical protein [Burkholderiaceae bacterium]